MNKLKQAVQYAKQRINQVDIEINTSLDDILTSIEDPDNFWGNVEAVEVSPYTTGLIVDGGVKKIGYTSEVDYYYLCKLEMFVEIVDGHINETSAVEVPEYILANCEVEDE